MNKVRLGIIGLGNIGRHHANYLLEGKLSRAELNAVCSTSPGELANYQGRVPAHFTNGAIPIRRAASKK